MEFRILGPLRVLDGGRELPLRSPKERELLAVLLLHAGSVVSRNRLIEALWGESPPPTADKALNVHVSQLRKALARNGDQPIATRPPGYVLRIEPERLDATRFERLVADAREYVATGDPESARRLLGEALYLWRGSVLDGLELETAARNEAARLEELRLAAQMDRIDCDLALGLHEQVIGELETLMAEHPLRERVRGQLMLALYRSGRQVDALRCYREAREMLVGELGIEPGVPLQRLERAILNHDPSLEAPRGIARAAPPPPGIAGDVTETYPRALDISARRWRATKRIVLPGVLAVAIAALVAGALVLAGRSPHERRSLVDVNAVDVVDSSTGTVTGQIPLGATPSHIAFGEKAVWVTSADDNNVSRIDPATKTVVQTIAVGHGPSGITIGSGFVWVANTLDGTVSRIDPLTNAVVQTIRVGNVPIGIVSAAGSVWVADTGDGTITRISGASGRPTEKLTTAATGLAFGARTLWASQEAAGRVVRVDPATGEVVHAIATGNGPTGLSFGGGAAWVANSLDGTVSRIDPETNAVTATVPTGDGPTSIVFTEKGVWVSNEFDGTLVRIDATTSQIARRVDVGNRPQGLATSGQAVLVAVRHSGSGHDGGRLTIRSSRVLDSIDTAVAYDPLSWSILNLVGHGLTGFKRIGGSQGSQLVPDLATSLPTPTNEGRTYTFRLRAGIRYSTGAAVKASDVRHALERAFKIESPGVGFYRHIVGAGACAKRPRDCNLSRGVTAVDSTRTITFHLRSPDPEFVYKLALPFAYAVPARTPARDVGTSAVPATGPYAVASYHPRRLLKLVRNKYFREWSRAAQPAAYPDEIVLDMGGSADEAVAEVERGHADVFSSRGSGPPSAARLQEVKTRFASLLHTNPQPVTVGLFLNTRIPPFDDANIRRALNFAADRAKAVKLAGGSDLAQPTCQILPPNFPGYEPYCPYSGGGGPHRSWVKPDLRRGRRLIAARGVNAPEVTVWTTRTLLGDLGPFAMELLRSLGYHPSLKLLGSHWFETVADSRNRAQIGLVYWLADYPAPSNFLYTLLSCPAFRPSTRFNLNYAGFCDPSIDSEMRHALRIQSVDPQAANRLWAHTDRDIVERAPWVPLFNPKTVDVLSKRVGNYQYSPVWGVLFDQLWVK